MEDYYASAEGITISKGRAKLEVSGIHGLEWLDFIAEVGERETYDAQEVLRWLGY
jgi:hypothetical protein